MKKKVNMFFVIIIIFIMLNIFCINIASAASVINPDDYNPTVIEATSDDAVKVVVKVGVILGAVRNISVIVAVIALMLIGFKYIMGSAEEKANYKATMWPYIVGCIMVAAGTTIVSFIYNVIN